MREAKQNMSASEFLEWKVFYDIRPFGPWQSDFHFAKLSEFIYWQLGGTSKTVKDFLLVQHHVEPQSDADIAATARSLFGV